MENKLISLKELAKLIKICKTEGVSSLQYGEIQLSMVAPEKPSMTPAPQARGSAKKALEVSEKQDLQTQFDLARESIEVMHVEDPVGFEQALINGELDEAKEN